LHSSNQLTNDEPALSVDRIHSPRRVLLFRVSGSDQTYFGDCGSRGRLRPAGSAFPFSRGHRRSGRTVHIGL